MAIAKPSFPQLQRGNPLADGLVGAWLFYEGAGANINDLSGQGRTAVFQDTNYPWVAGDRGWNIQVGLGSNSCATAAGAGNFTSFPFTVRMRAYLKTFQGGGTNWLSNGSFRVSGWWLAEINAGTSYQLVTNTAGANFSFNGSLPLASGNVYDIVVSIDAAGNATGYVNGVQDTATAAALTPPVSTNTALAISGTIGSGPIGNVDSAMLWSRALSGADVKRLFINDGGLFTPRRRILKAAAAGGFIPAWAIPSNLPVIGAGTY